MSFFDRYVGENKRGDQTLLVFALVRDVGLVQFALIMFLCFQPLTTIDTGTRGVITNGGAITGILAEGRHLVWPWEHVQSFNIRTETATVKGATGGTSDQQPVTTTLVVRYSISPDKVAEVFEKYSKDGDLTSYADSAVHEAFKAVTAKFTAPDLLNKRQEVSNEVKTLLSQKLATYGAVVVNVDMVDFAYDASYQKAINEKVQQDQLLQKAEKQLLTVNAQEQQKVEIATKEADALRAKADGEAYAALKLATAQADALKVQNAALANNKDVLELRRVEVELEKAKRWDGKLPQAIYAGAPIPFLSVPTGTQH